MHSNNEYAYYAVVGNPIGHSKSPEIMNAAIHFFKLRALYSRILTDDINDLKELMHHISFQGLNITAPFKKDIIELANTIDKDVKALNVANTLVENTGKLFAYNTDVKGVVNPIKEYLPDLKNKRVLVLGAGGAARSAVYALKGVGALVSVYNRSEDKVLTLIRDFGISAISVDRLFTDLNRFDIIVNTLPANLDIYDQISFDKKQLVFDASYKTAPLKRLSIAAGAIYIDGSKWLLEQARHAFKYFTGKLFDELPTGLLEEALIHSNQEKAEKIVLIGPMGAGKTTVGKKLAERLGFEWIDLDQNIERNTGKSIEDLIVKGGEKYFREMEKQTFKQILSKQNIVLSTGGGIVLDSENRELIRKTHSIFLFVDGEVTIKRTQNDKRPLLKVADPLQKAKEILAARLHAYMECASVIVNAISKKPDHLVDLLYEDYISTHKN